MIMGTKLFRGAMIALAAMLALPMLCISGGKSISDITCTSSSPEAVSLFLDGREAYEMGRSNNAVALFEKALRKDQRFALAWLYKAYASESEEEWEINLDQAIKNSGKASEGEKILVEIAQTYRSDNPEKRFDLSRRLSEIYPESIRALLVLAGEHQARQEFSKFRDLMNVAIRLDPEFPLPYRALGSSYLFNEPVDISMALKYMQKFVDLKPNEAQAHVAMGDVLRANLDLQTAKDSYSRAIKLDPFLADAYAKRGHINSYLGLFDEARHDFRQSAELSSNVQNRSVVNNSLVSYLFPGNGMIMGMNDQAADISPSGRKPKYQLQGNSSDHHFCCTVIAMSNGLFVAPYQSEKACMCLQRAYQQEVMVPNERELEANFAFISGLWAIQQDDYAEADNKLKQFLEYSSPGLVPGKNQAYNFLLGMMHMKQGKYNRAISSYKKSDMSNVCVKYNLGIAYHLNGDWEQAEKMFSDVSNDNLAKISKSEMVRTSDRWLKSLAVARVQNE
jgi:tetratricopeptide (TPR) repeat protein